jgi:hypothetical protein
MIDEELAIFAIARYGCQRNFGKRDFFPAHLSLKPGKNRAN